MADPLFNVVEPAPASPPRYGLVASVNDTDEADAHWQGGITWTPEECADANDGGTFAACNAPSFTFDGIAEAVEYVPIGIYTGVQCSQLGRGAINVEDRAKRKLAAIESRLIEKELWTGTQAKALTPDLPNPYLASSAATSLNAGSSMPPIEAMAKLEQALADCSSGRSMIHATPETVVYWVAAGVVRREGNLLLTALDTIVVPGQGYPGTSPAAASPAAGTDWAYGTGIVQLRRGPVEVNYAEMDFVGDGPGDALQADNLRQAVAWRVIAATFDPCCHVAALVEHCNTTDC